MNDDTPNDNYPPPGSPPPPPRSPFQAPSSMGPSGGMSPQAAQDALNIPSILIIIFSAIGILMGLFSLTAGGSQQEFLSSFNEIMEQMAEESGEEFEPLDFGADIGPAAAMINNMLVGLQILLGIFTLWAALKMRNLESWTLVLVANILTVIPCLHPCCCLALPVAIWNLVLINKPEIKAAFIS